MTNHVEKMTMKKIWMRWVINQDVKMMMKRWKKVNMMKKMKMWMKVSLKSMV